MRNSLILAILFSSFLYIGEAAAVFDFAGSIQTKLKSISDYKEKIQKIYKSAMDVKTRATQGFSLATNCFSNPLKCNPKAFSQTFDKNFMENLGSIRTIGKDLKKGDITKKSPESLFTSVRGTIYQARQKQDIIELNKNRQENNAVVADTIAALFAKGVATRQSILAEDGSLYKNDFDPEATSMDQILNAQNLVGLVSASRMARILELRAYAINGQAVAELRQQVREAEED